MKPITHLRSLAITTPRFDQTVDYYTSLIGLSVAQRGNDHVALKGKGEEPKLLDIHRGEAVGLRGIDLAAASRADVDASAAALHRKGVTISQAPREEADGYVVRLRDPDGNEIAIRAGAGT